MNRRIKKKKLKQRIKGYTTKVQRQKNKALCKRFPFLIPRYIWSDKIAWLNKPYDDTFAERFPKGWWKAFGIQLCEELREELIKYRYLDKYRISEIKSKFGELRIYDEGVPKGCDVTHIIGDYSALSENICMFCGRPDTSMINWGGWLMTICRECYKKNQRRNKSIAPYDNWKPTESRMLNKRSYSRSYRKPFALDIGLWDEYVQIYEEFQKPNRFRVDCNGMLTEFITEHYTRDLQEKAEKIRARWRVR